MKIPTMTEHPITPSPELVEQWDSECESDVDAAMYLATQASRWGADQELEACCEVLARELICDGKHVATDLRAARRSKPPSLNEVALQMLGTIERDAHYLPEITDTIRRALEALPE